MSGHACATAMVPTPNARARTTARYRMVDLHLRRPWYSLKPAAPVGKWFLSARPRPQSTRRITTSAPARPRAAALPSCSAFAPATAGIERRLDHAVVNCRTTAVMDLARLHGSKRSCPHRTRPARPQPGRGAPVHGFGAICSQGKCRWDQHRGRARALVRPGPMQPVGAASAAAVSWQPILACFRSAAVAAAPRGDGAVPWGRSRLRS